ncbi:MAG TPA: hypothetical protein VJT67_16665 [Longimicrobiaceae bacterium]|nr:hypothetical protein [Longimicrobiaceae bacterium]
MEFRRNQLSLFSQGELTAGLAMLGTPETAAAVAAQVCSIPAGEQQHYEWIDTTLMFASCVSDELATRILDWFGRTPGQRAALEAQMRDFHEWFKKRRCEPARTPLALEDVVFDTRTERVNKRHPNRG